MELLDGILTRRSVRSYEEKPVTDDMLESILRASMAAPSAGNEQAWQFLVITDPELLKMISEIHPNASMTATAAAAVLVCGDLSREIYKGYWVQDCSAAVENLLLAAHALGLGAVWTGVYPVEPRMKQFKERFHLPEGIQPFALVPIGYPAGIPEPADRFDPSRVHRNRW
jgi:nitroreductase